MRRLIGFWALLLAAACASAPDATTAGACETRTFAIDRDFERGAYAACRIDGRGRARLEIRPEDGASNPSPWYAFRIRPKTPGEVVVVLDYGEDKHRYHPKTEAGDGWGRLPDHAVRLRKDGAEARLAVDVGAAPVFVAAQPLETVAEALAKIEGPLSAAGFEQAAVGLSAEGRPVPVWRRAPQGAKGLVVLIARQHPPETTGAVAFDAFLARLLADDPAAKAFLDAHAVLVAPMLNPDGIARGHWRGNASGADVNRDWGPFRTPEAALVGASILGEAERHAPVFLADFHATRRDVIYAAPEGSGTSGLPDAFLASLVRRLGEAAPEITRSHNPEGTTAKAWSLETLGVAGFTYEVADEADLDDVRERARVAAEALIEAAGAEESR